MKPTIFLDIDGVLNSARSMAVTHAKQKEYKSYTERHADDLDPIALALIKNICDKTNARIVISSSWRKIYRDIEFFKGFFRNFDWPKPPIIGMTPECDSGFRGEEIQQYIDADDFFSGPWVAIDDDRDFYETQPLIKVDGMNGFSFENYKDVMERFGTPIV